MTLSKSRDTTRQESLIEKSNLEDTPSSPGGYTHLVAFEPTGEFHPQTSRELLDVFNGVCKSRTGYFRTKAQDGKLVGRICTDAPEEVKKAIEGEPRLKWIETAALTPELFERNSASKQESLAGQPTPESIRDVQGGFTHLVTFEPAGDFHPRTPKELLEVFNGVCHVGTGYFRTKAQDGKLVGRICTGGPEAVQKALEKEPRLKWLEAVALTPELFARYSAASQESLPGNSELGKEPSPLPSPDAAQKQTGDAEGTAADQAKQDLKRLQQ